jgi:hypothetical protein
MKLANAFRSIVATALNKQPNDSPSKDFAFRPLTKKEKEEFVNSLDAKGRQILAELERKPKRIPRLKPRTQRTVSADFEEINVA